MQQEQSCQRFSRTQIITGTAESYKTIDSLGLIYQAKIHKHLYRKHYKCMLSIISQPQINLHRVLKYRIIFGPEFIQLSTFYTNEKL